MRNLINIITEKSRGLLYRETGDSFFQGSKDNPTAQIVFDKAEYFPSMPGEYSNYNEMADASEEIFKQYPSIIWSNKPTGASKAFAILSFDGPAAGQKTYFGRYFNAIKPDMAGFWKNSQLPGGWQLNKSVSLKGAYYKLKPADLFPANSTFTNPADAVASIGTRPGTTPDQMATIEKIRPGMDQLLAGALPKFENVGEMATAVRDDLGETIGPIALIQGMNMGAGAEAARKDILGPKGTYSGSSINFPADKNNGLVDSYLLHPSGVEIGISSKGEKGASASVKNISDGVNVAKQKGLNKLLKTYANQVLIIEEIGKLSAVDFPIVYGIRQGIIDETTGQEIKQLIKTNGTSKNPAVLNLMADIKAKTENPRYNVGYHALAALARRVSKTVNADPEFGEACLKFLNSSPIIQLHLNGSEKADSYAVTSFTSKYPPDFRGTVGLDATKVYSATGIIGRVSFSYNGGGTDDVVDAQPEAPKKVLKGPDSSMSADVVSKPGRAKRSTNKDLGRERR